MEAKSWFRVLSGSLTTPGWQDIVVPSTLHNHYRLKMTFDLPDKKNDMSCFAKIIFKIFCQHTG
jgi:hypothetical protein